MIPRLLARVAPCSQSRLWVWSVSDVRSGSLYATGTAGTYWDALMNANARITDVYLGW